MVRYVLSSLLILLLFLCSSSSWCYAPNDPAAPLIQIPLLSQAPAIDGIVGGQEWAGAAVENIFYELGTNVLATATPVVRIAHTSQDIYISAVIPVPPGTVLQANARGHDGDVWLDDALEIFFDPALSQLDSLQFLVNSISTKAESKNRNADWNGDWEARAVSGTNSWSVEIRIPCKTLGLDSLQPGQVLGMNIGLDTTFSTNRNITWAPLYAANFHQPQYFGHVILGEEPASAQFNVQKQGLVYDIRSGASSNTQLTTSQSDNPASVLKLAGPGKLNIAFPESGSGKISWALQTTDSEGQTILRKTGVTNVSRILPVAMNLKKYFLQGKLGADIDVSGLETGEELIKIVGTVVNSEGKQIAAGQLQLISSKAGTMEFDVSSLFGSSGTIKVEVTDTAGNVLGTNQEDFAVPAKPDWLGSKAGISNEVLAPWKPLRISSNQGQIAVAPDGRKYFFGGVPFPEQVITAGASVLSGPVSMKISVDGSEKLLKGTMEIVKREPDQVILSGKATAGSLSVDSKVTIDFDGNAWVELQLSGKQDVTIDSFTIEAPIKKKNGKYRYYYPGAWGASENARAIEKDGWGASYVPYVWIGDDDRGFAMYSVSDQNWSNHADAKSVQILPLDAKSWLLRFSVISEPVKLTAAQAAKGLAYTMGFEATPNKKPEKDVWDYRIVHVGNYGLEKEYTSANSGVKYSEGNVIDLKQGTLDMWVRVQFDPNQAYASFESRGILNKDLLLVTNGPAQFGCYWNVDDRGMRIFVRDGATVKYAVGATNDWKKGELHHLMLTWGDETCLYVDGQLTARQATNGLIPGGAEETTVDLALANSSFEVDELRITSDIRQPVVPILAYSPDKTTLLLDHFNIIKKSATLPSKGKPGTLRGSVALTQGKFGKALSSSGESMLTLDYLKQLGVRTICFHEHWTEYQNSTDTVNNQENLRSLVKACHERDIQLLLYFGYQIADIAPEWDPYHLEALVMPQQGEYIREPMQKDYSVCYNSAWQDYIADGIDKLMVKYDIDGVYLDGTSWPWLCKNTEHGCGYKKKDGTIEGTYSISGAREMMRRIYTVVKSHKPDGQVNVHNSTTMVISGLGWATSTWDGEQFGSTGRGVDLDRLFPMDTFRAEFMGRQWGPPSELLCYDTPYTTHEAFSFSLLHDVLVRASGHWLEEESGLWKAMESFGRKQAQFMPYWSNAEYVKVAGDRCYSSIYVRQGSRTMLVVSNLGKDAQKVKVTLNLKKIGLKNNVTAVNAITGSKIAINNGVFTVPLDSFDYALVLVQ